MRIKCFWCEGSVDYGLIILLLQISIILISFGQTQMAQIKYEEYTQKYKFDRQLTRGSFGKVFRIKEIDSGNMYALKKLVVSNQTQVDEALNEIYLMNRLQNPGIVKVYQYYSIQIKKGYGRLEWEIGIVLQLASASLDRVIKNRICIGTWKSFLAQVSSLIRVLAAMQKQNIAHRDIKPANVLLFQANQGEYIWKLADFGLAIDLSNARSMDQYVGSFQYSSPILQQKYKYPNLKTPSDPFKNDVYSLGITLLETITSSRKYTHETKQKLEQICTDKLLLSMIDMMLEQQEERRPCFKQLLMILAEEGIMTETENEMHSNTKIKPLLNRNWEEVAPAKTINKKDIKTPRVDVLEVGKGVLCVAPLDGHILCGCDDGSIVILNGQEVIHCGKHHKGYVSQLATDEKDNIWSCGGDGSLLKWNYQGLLKSLHNSDFTVHEQKIKNIFKRKSQWKVKKQIRLNVEPGEKYSKVDLPFSHQGGISSLMCVDQDRYAVGFYDGYVFITWEGEQFHCKFHNGPVTDIKISPEKSIIYSSGYDGVVKAVKIENSFLHLHPKIFCQNDFPIVGIQFMKTGPEQALGLLTLNGYIIYIDRNMTEIQRIKLPLNNTMSGVLAPDNFYTISETGVIIDGNEQVIGKLGSRGWNSLILNGPHQLAVGSLDGKIARVRW